MKKISLFLLLLTSLISHANICGYQDDRSLSADDRIGRLSISYYNQKNETEDSMKCTVTMVSKSCAITAGHCLNFKRPKMHVEFQVPLSSKHGEANSSHKLHRYYIDKELTNFSHEFLKRDHKNAISDWAVIKIKVNKKTGQYPGEAYGYYSMNIDSLNPNGKEAISIIGYGSNSRFDKDKTLNYAQRKSEGIILSFPLIGPFSKTMNHNADTMGGTSGAAIINSKGEVIGVHTNGGCREKEGFNRGALLSQNPQFVNAINNCIASEHK